jgi:hypothetical protein
VCEIFEADFRTNLVCLCILVSVRSYLFACLPSPGSDADGTQFPVFCRRACAIIPVALQHVIFLAITPKSLQGAFDRDRGISDRPPSNRFDGHTRDHIEKYIFDTRLIMLAIFIGLLIVLWTPYFIWKRIVSNCCAVLFNPSNFIWRGRDTCVHVL